MGLLHLVRYAWSDLRHRRAATALNVLAVALSAGYILLLGRGGLAIYRYQRGLVAENLPTRVVASTPEVSDRALRFTDERLTELARLPGVARAFPHVELNVKLSLDAGPAVDLPAEGAIPADPSLAADRLDWGGGLSSKDAREAVLGRFLFEKLGGEVGGWPRPAQVVLQVGRTVGGREEVLRVPLTVTGLLRHQATDRVYVPVQLAQMLDRCCTHKIEAVPEAGNRAPPSPVAYPACYAYAPVEQADRVPAEAAGLAVQVRPAGQIDVLYTDGPILACLERSRGAPLAAADLRAVEEILAGRGTPVLSPEQQKTAALTALALGPRRSFPPGLSWLRAGKRARKPSRQSRLAPAERSWSGSRSRWRTWLPAARPLPPACACGCSRPCGAPACADTRSTTSEPRMAGWVTTWWRRWP